MSLARPRSFGSAQPLVRPVRIAASIAASTRTPTFSTERFTQAQVIESVRATFALNTQGTLRLRLWVCDSTTTRYGLSAATTPVANLAPTSGRNLLSGTGNVDYLTGDEGPRDIFLGAEVAPGFYLCVDADNTDTTAHTLDVTFFMSPPPFSRA
jgi:hypothetical protein